MESTSTFSTRLKELRKEYKMTQQALSDKLGIVRTAIANYETNRTMPDPTTLDKLSQIFNVSIDYLMGKSNIRTLGQEVIQDVPHSFKTKKEQLSYDEFMETAKAFFMDASEEDREAITRDISNLYWESKHINKNKYTPRNTKK